MYEQICAPAFKAESYGKWTFMHVFVLFFFKIGTNSGLPRSGKNFWKMNIFPGQGKLREFCGWSGKLGKDLESQGKVREFENKWLL